MRVSSNQCHFGCPKIKDYSILGSILGPSFLGDGHMGVQEECWGALLDSMVTCRD